MLTQISLMPTSRRCFGNPSSIVPSKAVCTKHRVLCTQQTRPSRGTPSPSAARHRIADSPLGIYATALFRSPRLDVGSQSKYLPGGYRELHSRREAVSLPVLDLSQGAAGSGKHTCVVLFASALFARVARPSE